MLTFSFPSIQRIWRQVELFKTIETGGLLVGHGDQVLTVLPAGNVAAAPESEFAIDSRQMADFLGYIDEQRLKLVGTYHSHPNGNALMSDADAAMARSTGPLLIVGAGQAWEWRVWDPAVGGEERFAIAPPGSIQM